MDEHGLRELISQVKAGRLSRRRFVETMVALGLTAPMAAQMLVSGEVRPAHAQAPAFVPARRGGGGALKLLYWQAPTILNFHFATGIKDQHAAGLFQEPLANFDRDGSLVPILAAATTTIGAFGEIQRAEKLGDHQVKFVFKRRTRFCSETAVIQMLPRHVFDAYRGAKPREAPANLKPIGTGAYRLVDFKPGDALRGKINPNYHVPNRPFFDTLERKGGGDAVSAARAVLQSGEYDYAWNMQVEDDLLQRLEQGAAGASPSSRARAPSTST
jgi:peptide/nickel transport system substrate-binding protein